MKPAESTASEGNAGEPTAYVGTDLKPGVCSLTMPCGGQLVCQNQMTLIVRKDVVRSPWILCEIAYYQQNIYKALLILEEKI